MPEQRIDEFAIILIGALVFFVGLAAINFYASGITSNVSVERNKTFLLSNYFLLDGLEKRNIIFEGTEKISKNLFEEKNFEIALKLSKSELEEINKIRIEFSSENGLSKLYLLQNKRLIPAKEEYLPSELGSSSIFIAKISEYNTSFAYIFLFVILGLSIIFFIAYREFYKHRDKIKIIGFSTIFAVLIIFVSISLIKVYDKVSIKIYSISNYARKEFSFPYVSNVTTITISFNIGSQSLRTDNLKIYLNDELIYDNKPSTYSVRITKSIINLKKVNQLVFETSNAKYEIQNLNIMLS